MYFDQLKTSIRAILVLTILTGVGYPLVTTGLVQVLFPFQANGSLIVRDGRIVGSHLIGQLFNDPKYFWSRPSATSPFAYNASSSSGSNLGPMNPALFKVISNRIAVLRKVDPGNAEPVPVDLVTASGSGLDPHITPAAARYQMRRVARARGIPESTVEKLINENTDGRSLGILGEPGVNVLRLNLALDQIKK